jgi:D-inositol-3-phosphate glycosyltransferase
VLHGHSVTVITSACGAKPGLYVGEGYHLRRILAWNYFEQKMGIPFPVFSPTLFWHAFRAARTAELVHIHDAAYLTSLTGALWANILRKPVILTQHVDLVPHPMRLISLAQKIFWYTLGRLLLHSCSTIVVLNSRVTSFMKAKGIPDHRIVFLPNGIDTTEFSPPMGDQKRMLRSKYNLPADKTLALFVGRSVPKKGGARLLSTTLPTELQLVIVGTEPPRRRVSDQHCFLGPISHSQVSDLFKACDIFVLPSQGEGFPVAVQEAMAAGLAVITTDDTAYDLYQFDRSLIRLIAPDANSLEKSIRDIAEDAELRNAMARYSREYALKRFALSLHVSRLTTIYQALSPGDSR